MQKCVNEAVEDAAPTKRLRRPSVRLQLPYYENSGHQHHWNAFKKDLEGAKKARTAENNKKGIGDLSFDDDVAIGNWKNFNSCNRYRNVKSKRNRVVRSCTKKWGESVNMESDGFNLSTAAGESEKQREEGEESEDENLGNDENLELEKIDNRPSNDDEKRKGVEVWLKGLGLGKYLQVFEVHEVDDDVLPLLTLEDLKDMGITAVGSRRKMYCSIKKLSKDSS